MMVKLSFQAGLFIQSVRKIFTVKMINYYKPLWAKPLTFMEAFYFCKKTGSSLWTPKTISDFENEKILDLLRSSNPNLRDGRLFWTGMERFNRTHFIYGESKHFLPSEYFNWASISFMPTVITHVPLLNIHICSELLEMYGKKQRLKNAEPEVSIYFSSNEIKPWLKHILVQSFLYLL